MIGITKGRLFTASTTAGFLMSLVAGFGVSAVAEEEAEDSRPIEEVIVTASKREVSLQDSSLAISAFTGEQLDKRGIREFTDIASAIPSRSSSSVVFPPTDAAITGQKFGVSKPTQATLTISRYFPARHR